MNGFDTSCCFDAPKSFVDALCSRVRESMGCYLIRNLRNKGCHWGITQLGGREIHMAFGSIQRYSSMDWLIDRLIECLCVCSGSNRLLSTWKYVVYIISTELLKIKKFWTKFYFRLWPLHLDSFLMYFFSVSMHSALYDLEHCKKAFKCHVFDPRKYIRSGS